MISSSIISIISIISNRIIKPYHINNNNNNNDDYNNDNHQQLT